MRLTITSKELSVDTKILGHLICPAALSSRLDCFFHTSPSLNFPHLSHLLPVPHCPFRASLCMSLSWKHDVLRTLTALPVSWLVCSPFPWTGCVPAWGRPLRGCIGSSAPTSSGTSPERSFPFPLASPVSPPPPLPAGSFLSAKQLLWAPGIQNIISRFHILLQTPSRSLLLFTTELLGFVCLYYCLYFFFLETILVRLSISPHDQNPSCRVPQWRPHCCLPWSVFSLVLCNLSAALDLPLELSLPLASRIPLRLVFFWTHWLLLLSRFLVSLTEVGRASVTSSQASLIAYWSFRLTVLNSSPLLTSNSASHGVWTQVHPDWTLDSQPFHLSRQQNLLPW